MRVRDLIENLEGEIEACLLSVGTATNAKEVEIALATLRDIEVCVDIMEKKASLIKEYASVIEDVTE